MPDRRSFPRIPGSELPWLTAMTARSPSVDVLNISDSGALIETPTRLKPGEREVFLLHGTTAIRIAGWVVRAEITRIRPSVSYRSAIRFAAPVILSTLADRHTRSGMATDRALIVQPSDTLREKVMRLIQDIPPVRVVRLSSSIVKEPGMDSVHFAVPKSCHGAGRALQVFFGAAASPTSEQFARLRQLAVLASGLPDFHVGFSAKAR